MRILVTGASGFIGSKLVEELKKGHEVRAFVRRETAVPGAEVFVGDIRDSKSVKSAMKGMGAVFHLAAIRGEKSLRYSEYAKTNIEGTRNVVEAAGGRRLIHVSTIGVIGLVPGGSEKTTPAPKGKYHRSKYEAEKIVAGAENATIIRPVITYGPGEDDGMVFKIAKMLKRGRFFIIGGGGNRVHLLSTDNLIPFMLSVLDRKETCGQTYIVADPEPIRMNRLCEIISESIGLKGRIRHVPVWPVRLASRIMELLGLGITRETVKLATRDRYFRTGKARSAGYNPKVKTEDGVRATVKSYLKEGLI